MMNAQRILSAEMEDVIVFQASPWDPIMNVTRVSFFHSCFSCRHEMEKKTGCKIYSIQLFCCCPIHEIRRRLYFVKVNES